jgi:Ser/Thr protein kinase RdoA (MazF antagonist)
MRELEKYLQDYFQRSDIHISQLEGGVSRTNYLLSFTSGERHVLHVGGSITQPRSQILTEIQNMLASSGLHVPEVLHGPAWVESLGNYLEICTFIEGAHVDFFTPEESRELGRSIAELHARGTIIDKRLSCKLPHIPMRSKNRFLKSFAHLKHALLGLFAYYVKPPKAIAPASPLALLADYFAWHKCKRRLDKMPHSYCHLDLKSDNILKLPKQSTGGPGEFAFLDFEKMEWKPCILDLLITACRTIGKCKNIEGFNVTNLHALTSGYGSVRKLTSAEEKYFLESLCHVASRLQGKEISNWHRGDAQRKIQEVRYLENVKKQVSGIDRLL